MFKSVVFMAVLVGKEGAKEGKGRGDDVL